MDQYSAFVGQYKGLIVKVLIVLAIIIVLYLLYRNYDRIKRWLTSTKKPIEKEYLPDNIKRYLEELADSIHADLMSDIWTPTDNIETASLLSDYQLEYIIKFYKKRYNKTLYNELKSESIIIGKGAKDALLSRCIELGYGF